MSSIHYPIDYSNTLIGPVWYDIYANPNKKIEINSSQHDDINPEPENSFNLGSIIENNAPLGTRSVSELTVPREFEKQNPLPDDLRYKTNQFNIENPKKLLPKNIDIRKKDKVHVENDFVITDVRLEKDVYLQDNKKSSNNNNYLVYFLIFIIIFIMMKN